MRRGDSWPSNVHPLTKKQLPVPKMMDLQTLIPFRCGSIKRVTRGQSFSLVASQFNDIQRAIVSACAADIISSPVGERYELRRHFNIAAVFTGFWTAILTLVINCHTTMNNEILRKAAKTCRGLTQPLSSALLDVKTSICEGWTSTSDDSPLFDTNDDFDDGIIGMEITFVAFTDEDITLSLEDEATDEYEE